MDARKTLAKRLVVSLVVGLLLAACLYAVLDKGEFISIVARPALAKDKETASWLPYGIDVVHNVEFAPLEEGWRVSWEACLPGDYNRDGEVSIADITPIAMHYGEEVAGDPYLTLINGIPDGVIDIAEVTKLAQFYGTRLVHFELLLGSQTAGPWRSEGTVPWEAHEVPLDVWPAYEASISVEPGEQILDVRILVEPSNTHLVGKFEILPESE